MLQRGSSPLSRGIRHCHPSRITYGRIIPALAGNTAPTLPGSPTAQDHPRSRGEYRADVLAVSQHWGSSPLSRGIPRRVFLDIGAVRIIPALAGNTTEQTRKFSCTVDHPRSRGEYQFTSSRYYSPLGSSPLSRGIPMRQYLIVFEGGIIPALAGNTTTCARTPG